MPKSAHSLARSRSSVRQALAPRSHGCHSKPWLVLCHVALSALSNIPCFASQELEQLEASLEGAEDYIAELEEKLMAADGGSKA